MGLRARGAMNWLHLKLATLLALLQWLFVRFARCLASFWRFLAIGGGAGTAGALFTGGLHEQVARAVDTQHPQAVEGYKLTPLCQYVAFTVLRLSLRLPHIQLT